MKAFVSFALASIGECARINHHTGIEDNGTDVWGRLCPPGLETNHTAETCIWRGEMFDDPDAGMTEAWARGSQHPLVFTPNGGLKNAEGELLQELRFMLTQSEFVHHMVSSMHHLPHHHTLLGNVEGVVESLEENAENLEAVEWVAEHAVEHLVLEGLEYGLVTLSEAAAHAGLIVAAEALGENGLLATGLEVVGGVLTSELLIGFTLARTAYNMNHHWRTKDARSREFTVALVAKADCIVSKVSLHHESVFTVENGHGVDPTFFVPEFEHVCGRDVEVQLAEQMVKTNTAMMNLFREFKGIGKCLFPEGPRSWSKSNCVDAIDERLRQHEGQPGLLYSSLGIAAAYAQESDEILRKPAYSQWFERYFNITLPPSRSVSDDLIRVRDGGHSMQDKATTCVAIVGTHRAFERLFIRLRTALDIYMHTFARERLHFSIRTTQHPCRRIFRKLENREMGLCKEAQDIPLQSPDSEWLMTHAEHLSASSLDDVGSCIEDSHPDLALSLFNTGPEEGENEEEERERHDDDE